MELLAVEALSSLLSVSCSPMSSGSMLMGFTTLDPPLGSMPHVVKRTQGNLALIPLVGSLVGLEGEVNRPVKTNTQTFIKFTLRHCRSGGRHCRTTALSDQNSGTTAPADNFESQFKISERKFRSEKFLSLLQI